jgi:hypothetical protein
MNDAVQRGLLLGCLAMAALYAPSSSAILAQSLRGPYARPAERVAHAPRTPRTPRTIDREPLLASGRNELRAPLAARGAQRP